MGDGSDKQVQPLPPLPKLTPPLGATGAPAPGQIGGNALAAADAQAAEATRKATRAAVHDALLRAAPPRAPEALHDLLMNTAPPELDTAILDDRLTNIDIIRSGDWGIVSVIRLEIAVAGLPSELSEAGGSIGSDLFIDRWTDAITDYLVAPADKETEIFSRLGSAVDIDVMRFGSEHAILFGELTDAMNQLVAKREELRKFAPVDGMDNLARKREIGGEINRLARHILMLDRALSDPRLQHVIDPKGPLEIELAAVHDEIAAIRTAERDDAQPGGKTGEQKTQARLGATSDLLAVKTVGFFNQIEPEEAFPETADKAAEQWVTDLVAKMEQTASDVKQARAAVVPDREPASLEEFKPVFDHWFAFLPVNALSGDPWVSEALQNWRVITQQLVGLGWQGWMANELLKPVGWYQYASLVQPQASDPVPAAHEYAATGIGLIPTYDVTSEFIRGFGMTSQAGARQELIEAGVSQSQQDFSQLEAAKPEERDALAVTMGLEDPGHPIVALSSPAQDEWNYLVRYESPVTETYKVSEHKSADKALLEFEAAGAQLYSMLSTTHTPTSSTGAPIGEAAIRKGGIEAAQGTSRAKYGLDENTVNPTVQAGLARITQLKADLKPLTSEDQLIQDLERVMSDALQANDSPVFRIGAILYMSWREHDLPDLLLGYLDPLRLAEAVWNALKIQALLLTLNQLGPIGQLFSNIIGKILHKMGGSTLGMVLAMVSWFDASWRTTTFGGARAQAFFAYDNIDALLNFLHGLAANEIAGKLGKKIREKADPREWAPKTTKAVVDYVRDIFEPDELNDARNEARQKADELAKQKGPDDPEAKMYKAVADELDGKPTEPQPVTPTPLQTQLDEAAAAAQKAGASPLEVAQATEKARADKHAELQAAVDKAYGELKPGETKPVVEFAKTDELGHELSTAKVELENGKVKKILVNEDASPAAIAEEVRHAKQAEDPRYRDLFDKVQKVSKDYDKAKPQEKLDAHKAAVQIEILDKKAHLDELGRAQEGSYDPDEVLRAYEDLNNLRERQLQLAELRARDLKDEKLSDELGKPADLHAKKTKAKLKIDPDWSKGTLGQFRAKFDAANPGHFLTLGELDQLYGRTRAEANPNRVMPTIDKFDVTARQGDTLELDLAGKKREKTDASGGSLVVSDAERKKLDDLLRKRDNARRERNKALDAGDEAAAKSNARKVRDASRDLGEEALDMWARQRAWEDGAKPSRSYKGQTSRSGDFDAVHTWKAKDGTQIYLVGEGKGGTADLGGKWVIGEAGRLEYVQQGTREYFGAICEKMMGSSDPNAKTAGKNLLSVLVNGVDLDGNKATIIYEKVSVPVDLEEAPKMVTKERSTIDRFLVTPLDVSKPGKRGTP